MNAHPHLDCSGNIAIIHNGIIENHTELQESSSRGSQVHFGDRLRGPRSPDRRGTRPGLELIEAVRQSLHTVRGAFALAAMDCNEPDVIVARDGFPLVVGTARGDLSRE